MKSYRQQKRKITEITRKQDELMGVSVKKSATGPAWGHHKTTESITKPHLEPRSQLQVPSAKIKLQLFPINEQTRLGLEKDGYNPFLELTLSARKRISSVARHLNTKWGSSAVAIGQLMLFPYNIKLEQVASCRRWTSNDNAITAWEVYVDVGSPSLFRLRYAWYSSLQHEIFHIAPKAGLLEAHTDSEGRRRGCSRVLEISNYQKGKLDESRETIQQRTNVNEALTSDVNELKPLDGSYDLPDDAMMRTDVDPIYSTVLWDDNLTNLSIGGLLSEISLQGKISKSDPNSVNKSSKQPIGPISDISIGGLLSEASLLRKMCNPSMKPESETSLQPIFLESSDISIGGLLSEASLLSNKNKLAHE
ncbi:UNVERIFIED_CONTAM: TSL-kinase interacting protein 1 [Sesamum latifolium]|uniref:TSL-kinase interacting protein 1 n=1 Tax=Sesamum latifolium TaxID=2727402 RepID=A0AAW2SG18_9LAMI